MPTMLDELRITGAAAVTRGANRSQIGADGWAVIKSEDDPNAGGDMATATKTRKDEGETVESGETATTETATETAAATETSTEGTTAETAATEPGGETAPADEVAKAIAKGADGVRELLAKQAESIAKAERRAEAAEKTANVEKDARLTRDFVAKAETFTHLPAKANEFGPVLRSVEETCDPLVVLKLDQVLRAYDEQVRTAGLFKTAGHDGPGDTSAMGQLEAAAAELRKADSSLTEAQAITKASEQHPELVEAHRTEQKGR